MVWYNSQAVRESGERRSLKIEQQERLYKALRSAKYEISSKSYILNKVKEAKKEQLEEKVIATREGRYDIIIREFDPGSG